jgi:hypothetical protein
VIGSIQQAQPKSCAADEMRGRRRDAKDTLMGCEAPRFLSVAIALIAALLGILVVASRAVEYEDTVPIRLTLHTSGTDNHPYGVAVVDPRGAMELRPGQLVRIELSERNATDATPVDAWISEVSSVSEEGTRTLSVDLSGIPASHLLPGHALEGETWARAEVVTRKKKLFGSLFRVFNSLSEGQPGTKPAD